MKSRIAITSGALVALALLSTASLPAQEFRLIPTWDQDLAVPGMLTGHAVADHSSLIDAMKKNAAASSTGAADSSAAHCDGCGSGCGDGCGSQCGDSCCGGSSDSCCSSGCDSCLCVCDSCCPCGVTGYFFSAADAWKGPIDDNAGGTNNFGFRAGGNLGIPLVRDLRIGAQIGASQGYYDFHGRDTAGGTTDPSHVEQQTMITGGFFRRSNVDRGDLLSGGLVFDYMIASHAGEEADSISLGQWRAMVAIALDAGNEVGVWSAFNTGNREPIGVNNQAQIRSVDQINAFWHHNFLTTGADMNLTVGWADNPGEVVVGAGGFVPLGNAISAFGSFHYIIPSVSGNTNDAYVEEIWNLSVGLAIFPGNNNRNRTVSGRGFMPLLPVADNGIFALNTDGNF